MTILTWPESLPLITKSSKSRETEETFRMSDHFSGPGYREPITSEAVTYYTAQSVFTREQWAVFRQFFSSIRKGIDPFRMVVDVESGKIEQMVHPVPDSFRTWNDTGSTFSVSFAFFVREVSQVDGFDYIDDFVSVNVEYPRGLEIVDLTINRNWPRE